MQENQTPNLTGSHAEFVRELALQLFDRTRPLHDLNDDSRHVLEAAALLVDETLPPSKKKPYKTALAMVQTLASQELSPVEQKVLAAVILFYQNQIKKKDFDRFGLSPKQQREALTISALLRIAEGLDDSRSSATIIQKVEPARDGMWIVVDGPNAVADAQVAQHRTRLWSKIGYPAVTIMDSQEAATRFLPFPSPDQKITITPGDTLAEAGRKMMRYQFAQMLKHEPGTRQGEDIEALHDMRVATRRMRAAFEVFEDAFEPGALKPYLKGLRATGRALGAVRDLDVFIEKAQHYLEIQPADRIEDLTPLLQAWEDQREIARQQMLEYLNSTDYTIFKREFNTFLQTPGAGALSTPTGQPFPNRVCELAPVLIFTRLAHVLAYDPYLPGAPVERLHALRIEFKKLRYTVEYFRDVLGSKAKDIIEELKTIQDHLGDLNDADVASQILQAFIEDAQQTSALENLEAVHHYLDYRVAEMAQLRQSFPQVWANFMRPGFRRRLLMTQAKLCNDSPAY
jgi:CHAD domain-containing protein